MTKFISFYSYKGGVGRTLSLVNVAAALAKQGKSVIIWDLDLEAPGIQMFPVFNRLGIEEDIKTGIVDILLDFQENHFQFRDDSIIRNSIYSFKPEKLEGVYKYLKNLKIFPVGRLDSSYSEKFSRIKWNDLFGGKEKIGFIAFDRCQRFMDQLNPDFVFIDSRTGLTNISLVTTIQLPDMVMLVFNYNEQNLRGLHSIHTALLSEQIQKLTRKYPLPVKTIATMVDLENTALVEMRQNSLKERFDIEPHYEIPLYKPLMMLEEILTLTDQKERLQPTLVYNKIARDLQLFYPQRLEEEAKKFKPMEMETVQGPEKRHIKEERYGKGKTFEEKTAEIFKLMGFDIELNKKISGEKIDISLKKSKTIGDKYDYYICQCFDRKEFVSSEAIDGLALKKQAVEKKSSESFPGFKCEAIAVTLTGFTEKARQTAEHYNIILYTYDQLLTGLMNFESYLTKVIQDFEGSPLEYLYIEQDFFPEKELKEINSFEFVQKWLTKPDRKQFSLLGDYGTGKTSFARKLAYKMAKEHKEKPGSGRIPFFVDLRQCQKALSLQTLLLEQLKNASVEPVNADIFLKLLAEGKILLIFDAFDEMATMSSAEITLNNFRQLNQAVVGEAKVILTSRTHYFRDQYEVDAILKKGGIKGLSPHATMLLREVYDKPEYEIVYLKEFTPGQVKEYLKKALKDKWQEARDKIRSIYNLEDLSHRPVLLDMIVKTLPKIDMKGKTEFNVVHLYEIYTFSWIERDDHRFQIIKEGKEELVEALACKLWQEGQKSIHYTALTDVLSRHLKSKIKTTSELETADYEVRTASFLVRDGEGNYSFAHKSFQEFFIARKIKKELLKGNMKVLDLRRLSLEIIFFLRHLMENDNQIIQTMAELLAQKYKRNISENALLLFYTVIKMGCLDQRFSFNEEVEFSEEEVEKFQKCLEENLPDQFKLSTAALNGITLSRMTFKHVEFKEASLENSMFMYCIFENITFTQTHLKNSDFSHSIFRNVRFDKAIASHCDFKNCKFENCTFVKSDFSLSTFMGSSFIDCEIEANDFTGTGFLNSNFDMKQYKNNRFFGTGGADTNMTALVPVLNLGHRGPVYAVAASPDNLWMVSGSSDSTVKLWDLETGRLQKTLDGHEGLVRSVFISPDNRWIVSGSDDKTVKLWELETVCLRHTLEGHKGKVFSVIISPDNRWIVSGSEDKTVKLWDLKDGRLQKNLEHHNDEVNSVFISPDNLWMVSGSDDSTVKLWDLETGCLKQNLEGYTGPVNSVFISPDNRRLVSGSSDHTVKLWDITDVESTRLLHTLEGHKRRVLSVFISPDNRFIASGSTDSTVKLWELETGRLHRTLEGHSNKVRSVFISPDNRRLVSGSDDHTIKLWDITDIESTRLLHTLEGQKGRVLSVFISPDNRWMVSGSLDSTVKLWELETGRLRYTLEGHSDYIRSVFINSDNHWIVSGSSDSTVKLWELATGRLHHTMEGHKNAVNSVFISPDNQWMVSGSDDYTVKLWDLATGRLHHTLEGHSDCVRSVFISSDNRWIVSASDDRTVKLWDLETRHLLHTLEGHKRVLFVFISPDNRWIVSASDDKTVKLWELKTGRLHKTLEGHIETVLSIFISPDNLWIVSGSLDSTVKLWDLETGRLHHTLKGHKEIVRSVFISPDNRWIVSGSEDNTIKTWDIKTGQLIYSINLLPGNNAITFFKDNKFLPSSETALQYLYYTDGLASYPAKDFPELRVKK